MKKKGTSMGHVGGGAGADSRHLKPLREKKLKRLESGVEACLGMDHIR